MTYEEEMEKYEKESMGIAMVKVVSGQESSVYNSLKGKEGILDLYHVSGEYDFFLLVKGNFSKLNKLMVDIQESHHTVKAQLIGMIR
jgi:hypothetical protein